MDGQKSGMCSARYCGACKAGGLAAKSPNCPTCRAPLVVSREEELKRFWKLVHDRSRGRHTPLVQNQLGSMYEKGEGVKQDTKEALKWYRKAAQQGVAHAQYNLGIMYDNGRGVKQDTSEAVAWYRKAVEQGHADAQYNLGASYHNGKGVLQDSAKALPWFQLAAEQGHAPALKALDTMQQHNLIPPPPPGTAVTTVLLTSAAGSKYNNRSGIVVYDHKDIRCIYYCGGCSVRICID